MHLPFVILGPDPDLRCNIKVNYNFFEKDCPINKHFSREKEQRRYRKGYWNAVHIADRLANTYYALRV
jgi:hypothetical protein